jgi:hypothetical protein
VITSVRAVQVDSKQLPFPELQPDVSINSGYEFTIQAVDPSVRWNVNLFIDKRPNSGGYVDCIGGIPGDMAAITSHVVTCRGLPTDELRVSINEISVLLDEVWELDWSMP